MGDRIRFLVNGLPAAALRDASSQFGMIGLLATSEVPMVVAFSSLCVREVDDATDHPTFAGTFDVVLRKLAPNGRSAQTDQ
ncbi:MAG: hypothetical protein ABI551_27410 [Polyangiaceae bacterium]